MDKRKLKWSREAFKQYANIVQWYSINVGKQAVSVQKWRIDRYK